MITVKECYEQLEGNYDEALSRLMRDELVKKFALKFPNDQSFNELGSFLESGDTESAFRAAHTLKGVCANLSFTKLYNSSYNITEMLRAGNFDDAKQYFPTVKADYDLTVKALEKLQEV